jgi:extracellular factor (EF) 3-hydroxypalmitic acid methyl ester biosynthesis protein
MSTSAAAHAGETRPESALSLDPDFVQFVDGFGTDLRVLESFLASEASEAGEAMGTEEDLAARLFEFFNPWLNTRMAQLFALSDRLGPAAVPSHGAHFRRCLHHFTNQSEFLRRTNERPRGYAGDSEMMTMVYDPDFRGQTLFGRLLHRHPLESSLGRSVRARVRLMAEVLQQRLARHAGPARVLSVACGPVRELRHQLATTADAERTEFVFLDQDAQALLEAQEEIRRVESRLGVSLRARTERLSVRHLVSLEASRREHLGTFDLVYSMGLFDYLEPPIARRLLETLIGLTSPGGTLVVGNFHVGTRSRAYLDYWMDWPLIYRTEADMLRLVDGIPSVSARVDFEPDGNQMFLFIDR